jgi:hypothetical protein
MSEDLMDHLPSIIDLFNDKELHNHSVVVVEDHSLGVIHVDKFRVNERKYDKKT